MKKENKITWSEFLGVDIPTIKPLNLVVHDIWLATEWNYTKNNDLNPKEITLGSQKKVWWKCMNNHEWQAKTSQNK